MMDKLLAAALATYFIGVPISGGAAIKVGVPPAGVILVVAPFWPVVALGYLGYRLAP